MADLVSALDRCEHGRHKPDNCSGCPGGMSTGNLFIVPGQRVGTSLHGKPIIVPAWELRHIAEMWLSPIDRSSLYHTRPI